MKHLRIVYATMALGAVGLGVVPAAQAQVVAVAQDSPYRLGIIGVERTEIGVSIRDVEEGDASNEGAVITEVGERSPADEAGLRSGDILVEFDGERVRSAQHLARLVQETPAGRTVNGTVMRDGARIELEVTPTAGSPFQHFGRNLTSGVARALTSIRTGIHGSDVTAADFDAGLSTGRLGIRLQGLGPQLAEYFGVEMGVLVTSVSEDSPAAEAGLTAGDVITTIYGRAVDDAGDLQRRVLRADPGEVITLGVVRDKEEITVQVPLAEPAGPSRLRLGRPRRLDSSHPSPRSRPVTRR